MYGTSLITTSCTSIQWKLYVGDDWQDPLELYWWLTPIDNFFSNTKSKLKKFPIRYYKLLNINLWVIRATVIWSLPDRQFQSDYWHWVWNKDKAQISCPALTFDRKERPINCASYIVDVHCRLITLLLRYELQLQGSCLMNLGGWFGWCLAVPRLHQATQHKPPLDSSEETVCKGTKFSDWMESIRGLSYEDQSGRCLKNRDPSSLFNQSSP